MVLLCSDRGQQVDGEHLQQAGHPCGQPVVHHSLEQSFALLVLVLTVQFFDQLGCLLLNEVCDSFEHLEDEVQDELAEGTGKFLPVWAVS